MKYMRRTVGYIWTDYKTNEHIAKELKIKPIIDKLLGYNRNWIQHVNRMPRNRLPRVMKHYYPTGRRNHGRPLKRLLDTRDRNGSTSGPSPWQIYDDDDSIRNSPVVHIMKEIYFNQSFLGITATMSNAFQCSTPLSLRLRISWYTTNTETAKFFMPPL